jgi:hypothetical protein
MDSVDPLFLKMLFVGKRATHVPSEATVARSPYDERIKIAGRTRRERWPHKKDEEEREKELGGTSPPGHAPNADDFADSTLLRGWFRNNGRERGCGGRGREREWGTVMVRG